MATSTHPSDPRPPAAWEPVGDDARIARLDAWLCEQRSNHQLYCAEVPQMSARTIARYSALRPRGFALTLAALGEHGRRELPFELCDELARFYARVFQVGARVAHRRLALALLLALGPTHRRYAVADVVRSVLWELRKPGEVRLAVEVIERSEWSWWYAHHHAFRGRLEPAVADALARAGRRVSSIG